MAKAKPAYLPQDDYANKYYEAQKQQRLFHLPYREFERLAANKLRSDLAPNIPKVNDGSLAAILRETPMRVLAQQPTGQFKVLSAIDPETGEPGQPQPWIRELVNIIFNNEIIPNANTQAPVLNKMQLSLYKALIYGSQPIYSFFTKRNGNRIADFTLPDPRDVYLEVGKSSDLDSDYIFMDTWYTPLQLQKIINAANDVEEMGVASSWDISCLKKILESHATQTKDYLNKNQAERNRPVMAEYFKFTTVFQRGIGAPFDTFYTGNGNSGVGPTQVVRHKVNEDPTGDIPIHYLYAYEDLVNPYGVGQIEISGGTQNVLDYLTQLHVLANQIGLQPPILVEGDRTMTDLDSMIYSPSQFWFSGNAKVNVMETSNHILSEFPTAYNLYKSQLANMQQQSTVDVPSSAGDPTQGKTPKALSLGQQREGSHDNYLRKQIAQTYSLVFKSMMNIYMANMSGEDIIRVTSEEAVTFSRLGLIPIDQTTGKPNTKQLAIDWDVVKGSVSIELDPDSSKKSTDKDNIEQLNTVLTIIQQNPYMLQYIQATGYQLNLGELYAELLSSIGVRNLEKILVPLGEEALASQTGVPPMVFDKPKIDLKYPDMPPAAQLQLLEKIGLNVTMADILQGPVLDPNIRGVYQPQPQPGEPNSPRTPEYTDPKTGAPLPEAPDRDQVILRKGEAFVPNPNSVAETMTTHGVDEPTAKALLHGQHLGLPPEEIQQWLAQHKTGVANGPAPAK